MAKNIKSLRLKIFGIPVAKQSFKFAHSKTGKFYKPPTKAGKETYNIRAQIVNQLPTEFELFKGPLFMFAVFVFPAKKGSGHKKEEREIIEMGGLIKKDTHPDEDNLMKCLKDALQGVIYYKDSQVFCGIPYKGFGKTPRIDVFICEFERTEIFRVKVIGDNNGGDIISFDEIVGL
jgi:Holliday junction resolvase RusA-like endonuclease